MIISEKQILQLMNLANELRIILAASARDLTEPYNAISNLLDEIIEQQPEELKVIE